MAHTIIRTAEQEEYIHQKHNLFFVRDVVTAATNPYLSLHRGRVEPGGKIVCHRQEHTVTVYILSGDVLCTVGKEETRLGAGCCVVVPPDVDRGFKNCGEQPVELLIVVTPPQC